MRYAEGSARRATQQVAIFFKQSKPQPDSPAVAPEAGVDSGAVALESISALIISKGERQPPLPAHSGDKTHGPVVAHICEPSERSGERIGLECTDETRRIRLP